MAENNKTRFFYVLYSDKTWVFDQSERAYYPIYILNIYIYISFFLPSNCTRETSKTMATTTLALLLVSQTGYVDSERLLCLFRFRVHPRSL